jgi:hypothetical protein
MTDPEPAAEPAAAPILRRPPSLLAAARAGLALYRREPVLRRILGAVLPPAEAAARLAAIEERHEALRRAGLAGYRVTAHIEALIARLAEAQAAAQEHAG